MSEAAPPSAQLITELKVSAHLMQLDAGVYCVYHTPGSAPPDPSTGLPGARLSVPPGSNGQDVTITGFRDDGWLGAPDSAALIRVSRGPAQVLMTVYQERDSKHEAPKIQVTKLVDGAAVASAAQQSGSPAATGSQAARTPAAAPSSPEIAAHLQQQGDVVARMGEWVGERGSQYWVEGFAVSPRGDAIKPEEIEYQAVLGRGWLSPWAEGGQYCGSRGMALPILGLRVRLRGKAAETHTVDVSATFTDGTAIGPVGPGEACEAESLAPLEAFCITILPIGSRQLAAVQAPRRAPAPARPEPVRSDSSAPKRVSAASKTKASAPPARDPEPPPSTARTKQKRSRNG